MADSYISESRTKNGMPYGGIPYDLIAKHYEETDPEEIRQYKQSNPYDTVSDYDNYVRSEIIDWSPDVPYFESDHARRDPALSKSQLNLRYSSGDRSSTKLIYNNLCSATFLPP